jgi:hypothetical protein
MGCGGAVHSWDVSPDGGADASISGAGGTGGGGTGGGGDDGTGGERAASADWSACSGPGQCIVVTTGCCTPCNVPQLSGVAGVNAKATAGFRAVTCPVPTSCPGCGLDPNPSLGARCVAGHCEAFDVRQVPEYSACSVNEECRMRKGLDCCECGTAPWTAVSVKGASALDAAMCAPGTVCNDCAPVPPAGVIVGCISGHCDFSVLL